MMNAVAGRWRWARCFGRGTVFGKKVSWPWGTGATVALALAGGVGCQSAAVDGGAADGGSEVLRVTATAMETPPTLDDPRWADVPRQGLTLNAEQIAEGQTLHEAGTFQLAHDAEAIYLRVDLVDHDLAATATRPEDRLFLTGDVAEWFIGTPPRSSDDPSAGGEGESGGKGETKKNEAGAGSAGPAGGSYLEMHLAPDGSTRTYRIQRPGLYQPLTEMPFTADLRIDGTLNDPSDRDRGWVGLLVLPRAELARLTGHVEGGGLTLLVGRYNYGRHLPFDEQAAGGPELTMWPTQPRTAFHLRPYHAPIDFDR